MNSLTITLTAWSPRILSIVRLVSALLFIQHGTAKLFQYPHVAMFDNLQLASLMGIAGILELVGGSLLALGLFTRPVAFLLSGQMAVAYFMMHAPQSFFPMLNNGEGAILFCFIFLYFVFSGGGAWSLDRFLYRRVRPINL